MDRRAVLALLAAIPLVSFAAEAPYDARAFSTAQRSGDPVLVMVHASWCPTCRKQAPVVQTLLDTSEFKHFRLFRVDFDTQPEALKSFAVGQQSTLIVFRGTKEVARSIGETRPEKIAELLRKAR